MKPRAFFLLITGLISANLMIPPARGIAHESGEASPRQLFSIYDRVLVGFEGAFEVNPELTGDLGWIQFGDQRLPYSISRMNVALADLAYGLEREAEQKLDPDSTRIDPTRNKELIRKNLAILTERLSNGFTRIEDLLGFAVPAPEGLMRGITSTAAWSAWSVSWLAKGSLGLGRWAYALLNPKLPVIWAGMLVRPSFQFDRMTAISLGASQTVWEGVETLVMGPYHWACVYVNIALIGVATGVSQAAPIACSSGTGIPLAARSESSYSSMQVFFRSAFVLSRMILNRTTKRIERKANPLQAALGRAPLIPALAKRWNWLGERMPLIEDSSQVPLFRHGFSAWTGEDQDSAFEASVSIQVQDDLEVIFSVDGSQETRRYLAYTHLLGIRLPLQLLSGFIEEHYEDGFLTTPQFLAWQALLGRLEKVFQEYSMALQLFAGTEVEVPGHAFIKNYYRRALPRILVLMRSTFETYASELHRAHFRRAHPATGIFRRPEGELAKILEAIPDTLKKRHSEVMSRKQLAWDAEDLAGQLMRRRSKGGCEWFFRDFPKPQPLQHN